MKKFIFLLINSLGLMLELAADRLGIVKYATTKNNLLFGSNGFVIYYRLGKQTIRRRPAQFKINDPSYWEGRLNRFKASMILCKTVNYDLKTLYESQPENKTHYNLLLSQLMKFWAGGPAPAPYVFKPGEVETIIGNGSMPDARGVTFMPQSGTKLQINWDTECIFPLERPDDALQIMVIAKDGANGIWMPRVSIEQEKYIERSDGTCILTVKNLFYNIPENMEVYCAIKFKTEAKATRKVNGIFKFPLGIKPIMLIP